MEVFTAVTTNLTLEAQKLQYHGVNREEWDTRESNEKLFFKNNNIWKQSTDLLLHEKKEQTMGDTNKYCISFFLSLIFTKQSSDNIIPQKTAGYSKEKKSIKILWNLAKFGERWRNSQSNHKDYYFWEVAEEMWNPVKVQGKHTSTFVKEKSDPLRALG